MKQGWEIKKLGEVCLSLEDGDWIEKKNQSSAGIRLIQTGNIGCGTYKDKADKAKYISEDTFNQLRCTEVFAGDILVSRLPDPVGRACIIPPLATKCITAVDCSIIRLNNKVINADWFIYYSQSLEYKTKVTAECGGATRDRISRKKLSTITIPVPSLAEQERIVEILDREFERIDALKANAEKSLQHAKDLFQSALKQELQPKEGWETKTLKQIGNTQTGTTPKTANKDYYGSYIPFIKPADVNIDGLGGLNYANEGLSKLGASAGRVFDANSILMVCIGATIGKVGYADRQVSSNQQINVLTPHNSFNSKYLYYYMTSSGFQHMVIREGESAKATLPIINKSKWGNLSISYPCKDIQDEIVSHLDELNKHCKALEENYRKAITLCDDMKQALLRKAFNEEL